MSKLTTDSVRPVTVMRRFHFERDSDASGVSGTGRVAEGVLSTTLRAVVFWLVPPYTMGIYQDIADVIAVHGHDGKTRIVFDDEEPAR
jgi:hypothetical protein